MPIESACGGAVGTAGACSVRDRGPRGNSRSRVTGRGSSSDRAARTCGVNRFSCSLRCCQGWELPCLPGVRVRAWVTRLSLRAAARVLLPESGPVHGALPEDANAPSVSAGYVHFLMPMTSVADPGACSNALIARRARVSQPGDPRGSRTNHARKQNRVHSEDRLIVTPGDSPSPAESPGKCRALWGSDSLAGHARSRYQPRLTGAPL